ncbi:MAG: hypothetical protein K1X95_04545 [Acidimicrobiia bacterium]|nr:hypothetical protein [Acidimicrobiia bacterium]
MGTTYRVNPFKEDGDPTIVAAERAARPHSARSHTEVSEGPVPAERAPAFDPTCPFCPGNETETPPEVAASRPTGTAPDTPGWEVRVVPNKYPALTAPPGGRAPGDEIVFAPDDIYDDCDALGLHEVAIHSPDHGGRLSTIGSAALSTTMQMWQERLEAHRDDGWPTTTLVVNEGREAGASLAHPHAQLFATELIPPLLERELWVQDRYHERLGRRLLDDVVTAEAGSDRHVATGGPLVAWAPYWAEVPYEVWIAGREPDSVSGRFADSPHVDALAALIGRVTRAIAAVAGDPALNVVVRDVPHAGSHTARWHVRVVPRTSIAAGFEIATGMRILTHSPEVAADALRAEV